MSDELQRLAAGNSRISARRVAAETLSVSRYDKFVFQRSSTVETRLQRVAGQPPRHNVGLSEAFARLIDGPP